MYDPDMKMGNGLSTPLLVRRPDGDKFALPFLDPLASKWIYDRQWMVLPSKVANISCSSMTPSVLLKYLNTVFATDFGLTVGVEACLAELIDDGCDLGHVYGHLRPWWPREGSIEEFDTLPTDMLARRQKDYKLRSTAMSGTRITNPRMPPRRVWDLYSNRILPYYALRPETNSEGGESLPRNLWTVSHSWRPPSERQSVLTTINEKAWRVPIPRGTTLNEIRNELLILGAEYVFLDVLCLRQKDEYLPESESIRKREWRLDIPTIGNIYNEGPGTDRPTVVYFNGLGLPFLNEKVDPKDPFHWFNRVWTLQESPRYIIFGGLEDKLSKIDLLTLTPWYHNRCQWPSGIRPDFVEQLINSSPFNMIHNVLTALHYLKPRSYSNPVDQVACLAYLLRCPTLPIYDADMDVEVAWSLLVECLPDSIRTTLLFSEFGIRRPSDPWQPTWKQAMAYTQGIGGSNVGFPEDENLKHLEGSSPTLGYRYGLDVYYHAAYIVNGCHIQVSVARPRPYSSTMVVKIPLAGETGYGSFRLIKHGKSIVLGTEYSLVSVGTLEHWVVVQVRGIRRIGSQKAIEVLKVSTLTIEHTTSNLVLDSDMDVMDFDFDSDYGDSYSSFSDENDLRTQLNGSPQLIVWR